MYVTSVIIKTYFKNSFHTAVFEISVMNFSRSQYLQFFPLCRLKHDIIFVTKLI